MTVVLDKPPLTQSQPATAQLGDPESLPEPTRPITLKVTAKGQITLRKTVLAHLGAEPGDHLEVDLLPNRRASIRPCPQGRPMSDASGVLAGLTTKVASLEEIQDAIERGWAGLP